MLGVRCCLVGVSLAGSDLGVDLALGGSLDSNGAAAGVLLLLGLLLLSTVAVASESIS